MLIRAAWQRRIEAAAEVNPSTSTSPFWLVKGTLGLPTHPPREMSEWPRATEKSDRPLNDVLLKPESNSILEITTKNGLFTGWLASFMKMNFNLRLSLFWHVIWRRLVVVYRCFRSIYLPHIQCCSWTVWPSKTGSIDCTETSVNKHQHTPPNNQEERRPQLECHKF